MHWAGRLKVSPTQIRLQCMRRKWASCSTFGRLTFCRDLLQHPSDFQDYVIVHELLHMRIPNHGKLFNASLKIYLGGNTWAGSAGVRAYTTNAEAGGSRTSNPLHDPSRAGLAKLGA